MSETTFPFPRPTSAPIPFAGTIEGIDLVVHCAPELHHLTGPIFARWAWRHNREEIAHDQTTFVDFTTVNISENTPVQYVVRGPQYDIADQLAEFSTDLTTAVWALAAQADVVRRSASSPEEANVDYSSRVWFERAAMESLEEGRTETMLFERCSPKDEHDSGWTLVTPGDPGRRGKRTIEKMAGELALIAPHLIPFLQLPRGTVLEFSGTEFLGAWWTNPETGPNARDIDKHRELGAPQVLDRDGNGAGTRPAAPSAAEGPTNAAEMAGDVTGGPAMSGPAMGGVAMGDPAMGGAAGGTAQPVAAPTSDPIPAPASGPIPAPIPGPIPAISENSTGAVGAVAPSGGPVTGAPALPELGGSAPAPAGLLGVSTPAGVEAAPPAPQSAAPSVPPTGPTDLPTAVPSVESPTILAPIVGPAPDMAPAAASDAAPAEPTEPAPDAAPAEPTEPAPDAAPAEPTEPAPDAAPAETTVSANDQAGTFTFMPVPDGELVAVETTYGDARIRATVAAPLASAATAIMETMLDRPPVDGESVAHGINVFWLKQTGERDFEVHAVDFSDPAQLGQLRTDNLTTAVWAHLLQFLVGQATELENTAPTRLPDEVLAEQAVIDQWLSGAPATMFAERVSLSPEQQTNPQGTRRSGWLIGAGPDSTTSPSTQWRSLSAGALVALAPGLVPYLQTPPGTHAHVVGTELVRLWGTDSAKLSAYVAANPGVDPGAVRYAAECTTTYLVGSRS